MSQTFNVTSCRACPLLSVEPDGDGDGGDAPAGYTCKHPQGGVVGHMSGSVLDGTPPPAAGGVMLYLQTDRTTLYHAIVEI